MQSAVNYKKVVIKIGSSILSKKDKFDISVLKNIVGQICVLLDKGIQVILISSGAISSGMSVLDLCLRPTKISDLQACASLGQGILMQSYINAFLSKGKHCAQLLLTWDDFDNRQRYLNAKNTILSLLKYGAIPIINENDTVSTEEIKFGDNDNLSSLVAIMVKADLLVILSDVDGLFNDGGNLISLVSAITPQIKKFACPTNKGICRGGMITKIEAAEKAVTSGIPCLITNGRITDILSRVVVDREIIGTNFLPLSSKFYGKKSWIAYSAKPKGKILVDEGAEEALVRKHKSLLCVGIFKTEGKFKKGDIVSILDRKGEEFARGLVSCSREKLDKIKGKRHTIEIIHRNNLAII